MNNITEVTISQTRAVENHSNWQQQQQQQKCLVSEGGGLVHVCLHTVI